MNTDAGMGIILTDGLCHDGAWECALETVRSLPLASSELRRQIITQLRLLIQPV